MKFKLSNYNTKLIVNNVHTVIFNSFSGQSVVIKNNRIETWEELESMSNIDKTLRLRLFQTGILIDETNNETKELENRIREGMNNNDNFILHINPTLDCNFNCWYCYENHIKNSKMRENVVSGVRNLIHRIISNSSIKSINVGFFGGEPLLYFKEIVKEIISHVANQCKKYNKSFNIGFTTNGYYLNKEMIAWLSSFPCSFQITLDGGKEAHDKTRFLKGGMSSYDKIVENIRQLVRHHLPVIVRINYTEQNILTVKNIYFSLKDIIKEYNGFISFDFQRVWQQRNNNPDDTEKIMTSIREFFLEKGATVHGNFLLHDVRFPCYADKTNYILVNYNGDIFKCTARDFTSDNRVGKLKESGEIEYDSKFLQLREGSKFFRKVCRSCRIAPLCGGGCIQKSYERRDYEGCILGYGERDKDNMVINLLNWAITKKDQA
ncbi:MAG: radical SAM protein [Bacteroidales bacterium]|nr:radical SAM protein [Bacteroidales bacterium]